MRIDFIHHKDIIAGFYFLISYKNYNQQAIKDLSEFYANDIDQYVIEFMAYTFRHTWTSATMTRFQIFSNSFKFLQPYPLHLVNPK